PTRAETFCVAAAEALAAGRPVVVGDSAGPREFVHPPAGQLVTPGSPAQDWAEAVEQVWRESADLDAQDVAREVRRRYGGQRYAERADEVYGLATDRHRPGRGPAVQVPAGQGPQVDVVVAVHDPRRQTDRAVRSVLDGSEGVD